MRILMISKACVVGIYQRKLEEIACLPGIELAVIVPPSWRDSSGELPLERAFVQGYQLLVEPIRFNGNFHLHYFPTLDRCFADFHPDVVHIDEEPYNLACWDALRLARRYEAATLFFSWQNIYRRYPPPFSWGEAWTLRTINQAIAGTESAAEIWRQKGYLGPLAVIPQFGVDPIFFAPANRDSALTREFIIGYAGRLVSEKGVDVLLQAVSQLRGDWRLRIVGHGPARESLVQLAESLNIADRVEFIERVGSLEMPDFYHSVDVIVLPSRTWPHWKEQFGRVLVEAMSCEVPVIGSDSAAIPGVMGDGGLIFPEDNAAALTAHLQVLMNDPALRKSLGKRGRARVLENFTHAQVAAQTAEVYHTMRK